MAMFFPNSANDAPGGLEAYFRYLSASNMLEHVFDYSDVSGDFERRFTDSRNVEILSRQL